MKEIKKKKNIAGRMLVSSILVGGLALGGFYAADYLRKKDNLIAQQTATIVEQNSTIDDLTSQRSSLLASIEELREQKIIVEEERDVALENLASKTNEYNSLSAIRNQLLLDIETATNEKNSALAQIELLNNSISSLNEEITELQSELAAELLTNSQNQALILSLQSDLSDLETLKASLESSLLQAQNENSGLDLQIQGLNSDISILYGQIQGLNSEINSLNSTVSSLQGQIQTLENQILTCQEIIIANNLQYSYVIEGAEGIINLTLDEFLNGKVFNVIKIDVINQTTEVFDTINLNNALWYDINFISSKEYINNNLHFLFYKKFVLNQNTLSDNFDYFVSLGEQLFSVGEYFNNTFRLSYLFDGSLPELNFITFFRYNNQFSKPFLCRFNFNDFLKIKLVNKSYFFELGTNLTFPNANVCGLFNNLTGEITEIENSSLVFKEYSSEMKIGSSNKAIYIYQDYEFEFSVQFMPSLLLNGTFENADGLALTKIQITISSTTSQIVIKANLTSVNSSKRTFYTSTNFDINYNNVIYNFDYDSINDNLICHYSGVDYVFTRTV